MGSQAPVSVADDLAAQAARIYRQNFGLIGSISRWWNGRKLQRIDKVQRLQITPGDVLVFTIDRPVSDTTARYFRKSVEGFFPGTHAVIIDGGIKLTAIVRHA